MQIVVHKQSRDVCFSCYKPFIYEGCKWHDSRFFESLFASFGWVHDSLIIEWSTDDSRKIKAGFYSQPHLYRILHQTRFRERERETEREVSAKVNTTRSDGYGGYGDTYNPSNYVCSLLVRFVYVVSRCQNEKKFL